MFTGLSALGSTENRGTEPRRVEVADWTFAEKNTLILSNILRSWLIEQIACN